MYRLTKYSHFPFSSHGLNVEHYPTRMLFEQTSVNTSTWYCYSKKIAASWIIMNLWRIYPKYSLRPRIAYHLYFGQIWSNANLLIQTSTSTQNTMYGSKSNNYSTLTHKTRIRRIKIHLITRKWPNIIRYFVRMLFNIRFQVEYFDLESSLFCFVYYST